MSVNEAAEGSEAPVQTTPSAEEYWLVATDGGVFPFGGAEFLGSTGARTVNNAVVGMSTP